MTICGSNRFVTEPVTVAFVSWDEVKVFIKKLNAMDPGKNYRLPTEAEWEYTCQAGTTGERYGVLDSIVGYDGNSGGSTHPVKTKQPNAWRLYDMLRNVREWCAG
jgi:formylglycine-generating enzyme required for sulfatase activity